ncbi:hypothetical protein CDIK_2062 [Cucumispora dikerogammari]|nr:hypothetical protein CDIK_2062 [Cucumispora dikerogammari]
MFWLNVLNLNTCFYVRLYFSMIVKQPKLRNISIRERLAISGLFKITEKAKVIETVFEFKDLCFLQEYKITNEKIIKGFKVHFVNIEYGLDNKPVYLKHTEFSDDKTLKLAPKHITCCSFGRKKKFLFSLWPRDKTIGNPIISYLIDNPNYAFKFVFTFPHPLSEAETFKVLNILEKLEQTIWPLKNLMENYLRKKAKAIDEGDVWDRIISGNINSDMREEFEIIILYRNKSVSLVAEMTKYFDVLEELSFISIISYLYDKTFDDILYKSSEIATKLFNEIKSFLKDELRAETKKIDVPRYYIDVIIKAFECEINSYTEKHFYLLTDIMSRLRNKITEISQSLILESFVFRLNRDTFSLERVTEAGLVVIDRETEL